MALAPQSVATAAVRCRGCGAHGPDEARYCQGCGAYLDPRADRLARRQQADERWQAVGRVIAFYFCYVTTMLVCASVPDEFAFDAGRIVAWVDAALVLACAWLLRLPIRENFACGTRALSWLGVGIAMLVPLLLLDFGYHMLLAGTFGVTVPNCMAEYHDAGHGLPTAILYVCVLPAVFEEIAFRGIIQRGLQRAARPIEAVALTALLFAIIHVSVFSGPYLFLLGLVLGWLRLRGGSLLPCIVVHFLHNFVVLLADQHELLCT